MLNRLQLLSFGSQKEKECFAYVKRSFSFPSKPTLTTGPNTAGLTLFPVCSFSFSIERDE
jgi:hypothetical protein